MKINGESSAVITSQRDTFSAGTFRLEVRGLFRRFFRWFRGQIQFREFFKTGISLRRLVRASISLSLSLFLLESLWDPADPRPVDRI